MEENRTQDPFSRWDAPQQPAQPIGQSYEQPAVQPQPFGQSYGQQAAQPYEQPAQPFTQQTQPQAYTPQPGTAQDLSQYAAYRPQYIQEQQPGVQQMDTPFGAASYTPYGSQNRGPRISAGEEDPRVPGRHHFGRILGIVAAVLMAAGLVAAWMLGWFHSRNGVYVWDDYANADMTAKIEIDGDKAVIIMKSKEDVRTVNCDVEFSGDTVKFVCNDKILICDYDRRKGIITEKDDYYTGVDLVFEKE